MVETNKKIIPMTYDLIFKKMWGDPNGIDRLSILLSKILNIPYNVLKNNVELIDTEKRINKKDDKFQKNDILVHINLSINEKVNIEMNVTWSKWLIDRNITYIANLFSNQLKKNEKYINLEPIIQINFNTFSVDSKQQNIIDKYYIQNNRGNKLTEKLQIYHINIENCKSIWYNQDMRKYSSEEQDIIRFCALMTLDDFDKIKKCLEEIKMSEDVKKNIEQTVENISYDDDLMSYFGSELDMERIRHAEMMEAKEAAREEGLNEGMKEGRKEGIEQGIEQGANKEKHNIALSLLNEKIDINLISKITGLSIEEINNECKEKV